MNAKHKNTDEFGKYGNEGTRVIHMNAKHKNTEEFSKYGTGQPWLYT